MTTSLFGDSTVSFGRNGLLLLKSRIRIRRSHFLDHTCEKRGVCTGLQVTMTSYLPVSLVFLWTLVLLYSVWLLIWFYTDTSTYSFSTDTTIYGSPDHMLTTFHHYMHWHICFFIPRLFITLDSSSRFSVEDEYSQEKDHSLQLPFTQVGLVAKFSW